MPYEALVMAITATGGPLEWLGTVAPPIPSLRYGRLRPGAFEITGEFIPIDVGEIDDFAFDFTDQVGEATIVSTSWTCRLAPFKAITDPAPQSHVLGTGTHRVVAVHVADRTIIDAALIIRPGAFSVATIGGFAASPDEGRRMSSKATVTLLRYDVS